MAHIHTCSKHILTRRFLTHPPTRFPTQDPHCCLLWPHHPSELPSSAACPACPLAPHRCQHDALPVVYHGPHAADGRRYAAWRVCIGVSQHVLRRVHWRVTTRTASLHCSYCLPACTATNSHGCRTRMPVHHRCAYLCSINQSKSSHLTPRHHATGCWAHQPVVSVHRDVYYSHDQRARGQPWAGTTT